MPSGRRRPTLDDAAPFWFAGPVSILDAEQRRTLLGRGRRVLAEARVQVVPVMHDVRDNGDAALRRHVKRAYQADVGDVVVSPFDRRQQAKRAPARDRQGLEAVARRLRAYHQKQLAQGYQVTVGGVTMGWKRVSMDRVGVHVPSADPLEALSLLMAAVPAKLAGVGEVVVCAPPRPDGKVDPLLLAAADAAEATTVVRVAGPAAVFAMAYGTSEVPRVDKVVGRGDVQVQAAKQLVQDLVGVDVVGGPAEVLVVADGSAPAEFAAWELAAAAEQDPGAVAVLAATSDGVRTAVENALGRLVPGLEGAAAVAKALKRHGALLSLRGLDDALAFANEFAPEHLVLLVKDPRGALGKVRHAGTVHLGRHSPAALGRYGAGTNGVLPTAGTVRFRSPLGVADFQHAVQWQEGSPAAIAGVGAEVRLWASRAGHAANAGAVEARRSPRNGGKKRRRR